jgi:hypothetical protein
VRARRGLAADDGHHKAPVEDEGELAGTTWSLGTAGGLLVVFAAGWLVAGQFSADARLVPRLVCTAGLVITALLLTTELRDRRRRREAGRRQGISVGAKAEVRTAATTFAWMGAFLALVVAGGYLAALLLFVPAFLLWAARTRPHTAVVYTVAAAVVVMVLPAVIPIDLPTPAATTRTSAIPPPPSRWSKARCHNAGIDHRR